MVRGSLFSIAIVFSLVIIRDFNVICIAIPEAETDSPLIVDEYGELAVPVSFQGVEAIARRRLQVIQAGGQVDVFQTSDRSTQKIRRKPFRFASHEKRLRVFVGKSFNHNSILTCHVTLVKGFITMSFIAVIDSMSMARSSAPGLPSASQRSGRKNLFTKQYQSEDDQVSFHGR